MKILRSILVFVLAQGIYGGMKNLKIGFDLSTIFLKLLVSEYSAEQAHLHLLDVFTYAKNRFNLSSSAQISDAVEIIASNFHYHFIMFFPQYSLLQNLFRCNWKYFRQQSSFNWN